MNKYVSIDIETTGLDPEYCQVIEMGAVVDDWTTPPENLSLFHAYVVHSPVVGDPYGLAMNHAILAKIAHPGDPRVFLKPTDVGHYFALWLKNHYGEASRVVAAGKNFASFDLQFLNRLPLFSQHVSFHHRCIDPAMFYWKPSEDKTPPSTAQCLARARLPEHVAHTAVEDAIAVVKLVREAFNCGEPFDPPKPSAAREVAAKLSAHFRATGQIQPG